MADATSQEKTEPASARKLHQLRREGNVWQARDLTGSLTFLVGVVALIASGPALAASLVRTARRSLGAIQDPALEPRRLPAILFDGIQESLFVLAPALAAIALAAILFPFLQVGPLLSGKVLAPKLERLDPVAGLRRRVFSSEAAVEFLKSLLKLGAAFGLGWLLFEANLLEFLSLYRLPVGEAAARTGGLLRQLVIWSLLVFLVVGICDAAFQYWSWHRRQRMSHDERKRESKEEEGDPHVRAARDQMRQELQFLARIQQVRDQCDFCLENPTHIVCAMRYDPDEDDAPRLLAKASGAFARKLREVAREEGIPIVRDVGLARAIYELEEGQEVPYELHAAAAELIRWLTEEAGREGRTPAWMRPRPEGQEERGEGP